MEYINFDAEVRPGEYGYLIDVRSQIGETPEPVQAVFPFTDTQLETHLVKLENAILRSGGRRRKVRSPEEQSVQEMGQALFDFLMAGEARSLYYECQREANRTGKGVRLRLHMSEAPELAGLPWEFLYDPRQKDYLSLNPYTPVLRYLNLTSTARALVVDPPLRILGMVASPSDLGELDVAKEKRRIETALASLQTEGLVELTWLDGQGWEELQEAMDSGPWHIFHFIGHGQFNQARDEGMVVFTNRDGRSHPFSATQLNRLLASQRYNLRLVVLNACEGAHAGQEDITSSVAATLAQGGIPAVLAMQYEITNDAAVTFAESFYSALANGLPIDRAVTNARNAVNFRDELSLEWGIPVLHMRSADGRLFALQTDPRLSDSQMSSRDDHPVVEGAEPPPSTSAQTPEPKPKAKDVTLSEPPDEADATSKDEAEEGRTTGRRTPAQVRTLEAEQHPAATPERPVEPIAFDWVTVPAGAFLMGSDKKKDSDASDDEMPQHTVDLPAFRIARVPVMNAQYKAFVDATGDHPPQHWQGGEIPEGKEKHPVVYISWQDALAFCRWAQVRLPSEAEWEKAARGTDGRIYPWGNETPTQTLCNFSEGFGGLFKAIFTSNTTPVDAHPLGKSPYGCLDMAGNVWEWTSSLYKGYPYDAADGREDAAASGSRVLRGGSFSDFRHYVRCASRNYSRVGARGNYWGFRVVSPGL